MTGVPGVGRAHAALVTANPGEQQQLNTAPREIVLTFTEPVGAVFVKVVDSAGHEVGRPGEVWFDRDTLHLPLRQRLSTGTFIVSYRVVSTDTHSIGGSYVFAVGEPVGARIRASPTPANLWSTVVAGVRAVQYASVLLAIGSALLLIWLRFPSVLIAVTSRQGLWASGIATASYVLLIPLGGADMISADATAMPLSAAWAMGAKTTLMRSALLEASGALLLAYGFSGSGRRIVLGAGALLVIASLLVTGHAATAQPVGLMAASVALHLVCAGFWFAALVPLICAVRVCNGPVASAVVEQFSKRALWTVPTLFVSGGVLALVQLGEIDQLWKTAYGERLALKIALFAVLLALAFVNKNLFTPAVARADAVGSARLRKSMQLEYVLINGIAVIAASLTIVPPPRALLAERGADAPTTRNKALSGFETIVPKGKYLIEIKVTPAKRGQNEINVKVSDASGAAVNVQSSRVYLSLPDASIERAVIDGKAKSPGVFQFDTNVMAVSGVWQMRIEGSIGDFDTLAVDLPVVIGR